MRRCLTRCLSRDHESPEIVDTALARYADGEERHDCSFLAHSQDCGIDTNEVPAPWIAFF